MQRQHKINVFSFFFILAAAFCLIKDVAALQNKYDYIVVGAGTAGSVVAARIAQDPRNFTVLLIERGVDNPEDPTLAVPTVNSVLPVLPLELLPTEHFHTFEPLTTRIQTASFVPNQAGGGPEVSGAFTGRGDPSNYDEWASITGYNHLKYNKLVPYFKASENVAVADSASPLRGRDGPIEVTFLHPDPGALPWVDQQAASMGIPRGADYSATTDTEGVWPMQRSLKRGSCDPTSGPCDRQSSYGDYIVANKDELPNLDVVLEASAIKLIFQGNRAKGVRLVSEGLCRKVTARREVIVSAGTLGSAKLLMLSGIGDSAALTERGIPVKKHLPGVGKNIRDHFQIQFTYYLPTAANITVPSSVTISFLRSPFNGGHVDLEISWGMFPTGGFAPGAFLVGFIVQVRSECLGEALLTSKNPYTRMNVTLGMNPELLQPITWALLNKVRPWLAPNGTEMMPGVQGLPDGASLDEQFAYLSSTVEGWYHMAGTAKMGPSTDPMAVVDGKFRVHGIDRLRVVDCSIMPRVISTHPSGTAFMLGELASKFILN